MFIFNLITILIIIVAILLLGAILLQEPKERITPSGGGAASIQRIGINQKADFLEKATWVLIGLLLFLTFLSSIFLKNAPQTNRSPNLAKAQQEQASTSTTTVPSPTDAGATAQKELEPAAQATTSGT
ncbi:preprotein translocase subunit SecG [Cardinium endosymbiont of Nabis limbatus]|uniref:preprotein translocase subunit SecG n=1 Tax=Cardinium endosymbiont of Nabis limbatus TaxID=3066217 RepID=UPI003AF3F3C7